MHGNRNNFPLLAYQRYCVQYITWLKVVEYIEDQFIRETVYAALPATIKNKIIIIFVIYRLLTFASIAYTYSVHVSTLSSPLDDRDLFGVAIV